MLSPEPSAHKVNFKRDQDKKNALVSIFDGQNKVQESFGEMIVPKNVEINNATESKYDEYSEYSGQI